MSQELKTLNRQRYAQAAQNYVDSPVHAKGMGLELMLELAELQPDYHVLDVATGGGHTALMFAPHVQRVTATDFTETMLMAARQFIMDAGTTNMDFYGADAEHLPFASNTFDVVTCRVAAHHFPDIGAFMRSTFHTLKPNGILLVYDHVVPNRPKVARYVNAYEKLRDPAHARALPEFEWRKLFTETGFTIEHTEQFTFQHDILRWAKRQNCSDETIEKLHLLLMRAPDKVLAWMQPENLGTPSARYTDHHIILKGRKPR